MRSVFLRTKTASKLQPTPGSVQISLDYSVPVDLLVYKFTLDFHDHADNRSI